MDRTGQAKSCGIHSREGQIMKYIVERLYTHQEAALWLSLAFLVAVSAYALWEAFNHPL